MIYKCKYFDLSELMPDEMIEKYGEQCWQFLDYRLLVTLDFIREKLNRPIYVNGNGFNYRGYRPNTYKDSLYASQHLHGRAADFDVEGMLANEVRNWLKNNANQLPFPIWVEDGVNWVHIDVRQSDKGQIYFFNP